MVLRALAFCLGFTVLFACQQAKPGGRYISDKDTTFSKDIRDISAKINDDPRNADLYYKRGNAFFYQDKFKDALIDLDYAVLLDSNNAVYHHLIGETVLKLDTADSRKAMYHLEKALKLKPDFSDAIISLGKLHLARQEYKKAEDLFKKLTATNDYADRSFVYLGICRKEQKDTIQALAYFDKAQQINPNGYEAAIQIALIKAAQKDPLAMQYFDKVIAINEYSDEAFYGKALLFQANEQYKDALVHYEKARTINPGHILAIYGTGVLYNLFEDYGKAEEMCNKVLDLAPEYANAYALRGFTFEKRGDKQRATADYNQAIKLDAKNEMALLGLKSLK
ncbi:MAG: tetratricopeptide repeat protein [Bacteroidia bacterium]|nr:tetratricopeptide repeat protein [Bacteroidia bacterium]